MKKTLLLCGLTALAGAALGDEIGQVISSTPVVQQVAVPRQVCSNEAVVGQAPRSGAGAMLGAIAGGAMGNAVGQGAGRAAATVIGVIGGAALGDRIEGGPPQMQNMQQCSTQTFYENRTTGWNVVYEYAGKQYTAQLPSDPGPTVRLQITPMTGQAAYTPPASYPPVYAPPYAQAAAAYPAYPAYYASPYYYPGYAVGPYFPPIGVSLNLGYSRVYGGQRGHWR